GLRGQPVSDLAATLAVVRLVQADRPEQAIVARVHHQQGQSPASACSRDDVSNQRRASASKLAGVTAQAAVPVSASTRSAGSAPSPPSSSVISPMIRLRSKSFGV